MVGKKQARQFHQALYSINQKSSDLKKWEALKQTPKLGTAYKWDYWVIIDEEKTQICCPCTITSAHEIADCKIQGGEVHLQVRAPLRCQGWDPSVRREVHWFWHDQKYSGASYVCMKISYGEIQMHLSVLPALLTPHCQVYEMYVAGFKFHLLNNAFTSHWGFQVTLQHLLLSWQANNKLYKIFQSLKSRPAWRAKQQEENNARFDEFAREVLRLDNFFHTYMLFIAKDPLLF